MSVSKSVAAALPPMLDEELPAEGDEPPERHSGNSDSDFAKHTIKQSKPAQSLLTRGLVEAQNPAPKRTSRLTFGVPSTPSYLSAASTADLTSDAGSTDVSRTSSPVFPTFILPNLDAFPGLMKSTRQSSIDSEGSGIQIVDNSTDDNMDSFHRRRRITFASDVKSSARQPFTRCRPLSPAPQKRTGRAVSPAPVRRLGIKFSLEQKPPQHTESGPSTPRLPSSRKPCIRFACPDSTTTEKELEIPTVHKRSDSQSTITAASPAIRFVTSTHSIPQKKAECNLGRFYEFASSCSEDESWMDLSLEKKGLMKVDDIMKKERDVQKLSRECSDEFDDEEQEENDDEIDEDEDEDDNDNEEDEDDDDDEDEDEDEDEFSGNETDNEDGFASDSDGDNSFFGSYAPPTTFFNNIGHVFRRRLSNDSDASGIAPEMSNFSKTTITSDLEQADLPDSTDFVCGTLDEDKPLEEAFKNRLEEAKKAEQGIYYIDPDFPASDNDDEDNDDDEEDEDDDRLPAGRMSRSNSPAPRGRAIEQIAPRRFHSPPPKAMGRITRHMSPPPPKRRNSHDIHKTKSLPRTSSMYKAKKTRSKTDSAASSLRTEAVAIVRPRGAMDIVEGMKRRKERRKARFQRKEDGIAPGEGVEKMRQLGLCKAPANPQWIFSV
jgi:hypothetical protein